jgi:hypothetical protein
MQRIWIPQEDERQVTRQETPLPEYVRLSELSKGCQAMNPKEKPPPGDPDGGLVLCWINTRRW